MRYKRLKLSAVLVFGLGLPGLHAQESVIATGGNASGSEGTVSYTVGQVAYQIHTGTSGSVAEGVQQPFEISVVTGIKDAKGIKLSFSVYPNPTTNYLTLSIDGDVTTTYDLSRMSYQLYDITGKFLENKKIISNQTNIAMENLIPDIYFVKVIQGNKEVKTFKIIKSQ